MGDNVVVVSVLCGIRDSFLRDRLVDPTYLNFDVFCFSLSNCKLRQSSSAVGKTTVRSNRSLGSFQTLS